jgi:hypothetical protein
MKKFHIKYNKEEYFILGHNFHVLDNMSNFMNKTVMNYL